MNHKIALACLAAFAGHVCAASPTLPGPAFPTFDTPAQVKAACDKGLAGAHERLKRLERRPADAGWLAASDDFNAYIEDAYYPIGLLSNVHPNPAVRKATQACELRWQDFSSSLGLNEVLYRAALQVRPSDDIDREARRLTLEG